MMKNKIHKLFIIRLIMCILLFAMLPYYAKIGYGRIEAKVKKPKHSISITKKSATIYEGQRIKLKTQSSASKKKIRWSSKDPKIATVGKGNGNVTGKKAGTVWIYAHIVGTNKKASCKVTVGQYINKLNVSSADNVILDINGNQTSRIRAEVSPSKALVKGLSYKSMNPSIATVSSSGVVKAMKPGLTEIKVTSKGVNNKNKNLTMSIRVYVQDNKKAEDKEEPKVPVIDDKLKEVIDELLDPGNDDSKTGEGGSGTGEGGSETGEGGSGTGEGGSGSGNEASNPNKDQLVARTFVHDYDGDVSTIYWINRSYQGSVTIQLNGKVFRGEASAVEMLKRLSTEYVGYTNSSRTVSIIRKKNQQWWTLTDLTVPREYMLRAWQVDTVFNTSHGLIITKGDTTNQIVFK